MVSQFDVVVDGFGFILMSYGYQPIADASSAKSAYVAVNVDEFLEDEEKYPEFLSALSKASELAQEFDIMIKASEFVLSDLAQTALQTWEEGKLHSHALFCDAAIYVSQEQGFPLEDEVKTKLRDWNLAASKKISGSA